MKAMNKTKEQLVEELVILKQRIDELEEPSLDRWQATQGFISTVNHFFPQERYTTDAIYVIFDRKYEFVNQKFADLFGTIQEEVCGHGFDPMTLIAPESQNFVKENHKKGYRGELISQQFKFTGQRLDGFKVECETFVMYIPYKWGIAIHGMLREINLRKSIRRSHPFYEEKKAGLGQRTYNYARQMPTVRT